MAEPRRFTFDAAVRVLTFRSRRRHMADAARFAAAVGLSYPGAEVVAVESREGVQPPLVTVALIGLTGPSGVLPRHYSEAVVAALRNRSPSLADFFDAISQRVIAAFAEAGAKYRPHRSADAALLSPGEGGDPVADALLSLTGFGLPGLADRLPAGAAPLRHYAGLFAAHPRSADRLEALASDWLGRPVRVQQFAGAWLPVPTDQRTRLPVGLAPGAFMTLGDDATIGVRAWDQQARIVLQIGPLDYASFARLLPNRPALRNLVSLVRAYVGFEIGFAVNLVLAHGAVPPLILDPATECAPRLGWNSWLPLSEARPRRVDARDALFEAEIVEGQLS